MKINTSKIYGVPAEAKNANFFVRVISRHEDGTLICDGYKPSIKPKNPVDKFTLKNVDGEWKMQEFMTCGSLSACITPLGAILSMDPDNKNALLTELAEDGAIIF